MAGGGSDGFWPVTRQSRPKQFLDISSGGRSYMQEAYYRSLSIVPKENILVITLEDYAGLVRDQLPELPEENLLLEPLARRTAPCIAYSTYTILQRNKDAVVLVTPSDIRINDESGYAEAASMALEFASSSHSLVTLGVLPTRPDPNFGYIQAVGGGKSLRKNNPVKVKTFTEKPSRQLAEVFYSSGEFVWNSGIFVWRADAILTEMRRYVPELTGLFDALKGKCGTEDEKVIVQSIYNDCTRVSIDFAVMEKTDKAWLFPVEFGWRDIDSWESLYAHSSTKDKDGNIGGAMRSYVSSCRDNIIIERNRDKLIAVEGLENYIVVDTPDVLLICPKDNKRYKEFVSSMNAAGLDKYR